MMGDCAAAIALQYSMNTNSNYGFMNFMQYSTPGTCCNYNMNVGAGECGNYIQPWSGPNVGSVYAFQGGSNQNSQILQGNNCNLCMTGGTKGSGIHFTACSGSYQSWSVITQSFNPCPSCGAGNYCPIVGGAATCTACPPNSYCTGALMYPISCSAGQWSQGGQSSCQLCSPGQYSNAGGGCASCAPGTVSNAGYYSFGSTGCNQCPVNTYSAISLHSYGYDYCAACAPGTYTNNQTAQLSCTPAPSPPPSPLPPPSPSPPTPGPRSSLYDP